MRIHALVLLLAACAAEITEDAIVLSDWEENEEALRYRWERRGDRYVRDGRSVPVALVEHLRRLALEEPSEFADLPEELGITAEKLERHRWEIAEAALRYFEDFLIEVPEDVPSLATVRKTAREVLIDPGTDTFYSLLTIDLPGDPPIRLWTDSQRFWAQPWHAVVGETERTVCSLEISKAVALLADPRGYQAAYLNGAQYWEHDFWRDWYVWEDVVGDPAIEAYAREACEGLPGYEALAKRFRIDDATIGDVNQQPTSLFVELVSVGDGPADALRVWIHFEEAEPASDWEACLTVVDRCEAVLRRFPALLEWKAAKPGRRICLDVVNDTGISSTDNERYVLPPWREAGLQGEPEFELILREDRKAATAFLSSVADGALLEYAEDLFPGAGDRAVLRPDGTVARSP